MTTIPLATARTQPLQRQFSGLRSARRGDYRAVYRIDDERIVVVVITIGHYRGVYR
ncbi:MAG: type II toxin-antitoxin system RelE/ParE family toxin [Dermatophilus congolensis]|nr:type II toxin-antitoxin system RelE/ParE family toxin [Dermatophilus congolensis]